MLIHLVCAARPNFMKVAPLYHALKREAWAEAVIVHTGQHYDLNMSDAFFKELDLPDPDINLGVGSGTHAEQTGRVLMAYERVLLSRRPDLAVVVGDVNSTLAATLAACKLGIKVAHLEAGLRSYDRRMPEEINRVATDALADLLLVPSRDAGQNLLDEGVAAEKIHLVGNIMIDSLEMLRDTIEQQETYRSFGLTAGRYGVVTLHRPANVDDAATLATLCGALQAIAQRIPLVFPIHPRTRGSLERHGLLPTLERSPNLRVPDALSYVPFMNLVLNSRFVLTDSGGVQEETSYLGIPCLTLRDNTERPITVTHGTNQLCKVDDLERRVGDIWNDHERRGNTIEFWDGKTAERIVGVVRAI